MELSDASVMDSADSDGGSEPYDPFPHIELPPPKFTLAKLSSVEFGIEGSLSFRHCFVNPHRERICSPWDDIALYHGPDRFLHCVCTTPAGTWIRCHVASDEPCHPIRTCRQRESPAMPARFLENAIGHVGFLPQTLASAFEDGGEIDPQAGGAEGGAGPDRRDSWYMHSTSTEGEESLSSLGYSTRSLSRSSAGAEREAVNRPVDVLEIGSWVDRSVGEVYPVKPLAAFVVANEEGRKHVWKIIAIAADDPMAEHLHDVADVHRKLPGTLELTREWLRTAVCTEPGDVASSFLLDDQAASLDITLSAIQYAHQSWRRHSAHVARPNRPQRQHSAILPRGSDLNPSSKPSGTTTPPSTNQVLPHQPPPNRHPSFPSGTLTNPPPPLPSPTPPVPMAGRLGSRKFLEYIPPRLPTCTEGGTLAHYPSVTKPAYCPPSSHAYAPNPNPTPAPNPLQPRTVPSYNPRPSISLIVSPSHLSAASPSPSVCTPFYFPYLSKCNTVSSNHESDSECGSFRTAASEIAPEKFELASPNRSVGTPETGSPPTPKKSTESLDITDHSRSRVTFKWGRIPRPNQRSPPPTDVPNPNSNLSSPSASKVSMPPADAPLVTGKGRSIQKGLGLEFYRAEIHRMVSKFSGRLKPRNEVDMPGGSLQGMPGGSLRGMPDGNLRDMPGGSLRDMPGGSLRDMPGGSLRDMPGGRYGGHMDESGLGSERDRGQRGRAATRFRNRRMTVGENEQRIAADVVGGGGWDR